MMEKIFRASILNPIDANTWRFFQDGALGVDQGIIMRMGDFTTMLSQIDTDTEVEDLDGVIVPGFVDVHLHWVQHRVKGRFSGELLAWLREYRYRRTLPAGHPEP